MPSTLLDPATYNSSMIYLYRIVAKNTVGYGAEFPSLTVQSVSGDADRWQPPSGAYRSGSNAQAAGPQNQPDLDRYRRSTKPALSSNAQSMAVHLP